MLIPRVLIFLTREDEVPLLKGAQCTSPDNPMKNHIARKGDLHFLNQEGMVACNPRDLEAAHRAEMETMATEKPEAVSCEKCLKVMRKTGILRTAKVKMLKRIEKKGRQE